MSNLNSSLPTQAEFLDGLLDWRQQVTDRKVWDTGQYEKLVQRNNLLEATDVALIRDLAKEAWKELRGTDLIGFRRRVNLLKRIDPLTANGWDQSRWVETLWQLWLPEPEGNGPCVDALLFAAAQSRVAAIEAYWANKLQQVDDELAAASDPETWANDVLPGLRRSREAMANLYVGVAR